MRLTHVLVLSICCLAGRADVVATQTAVERLDARDVALDLHSASGQLRDYLKPFDLKPRPFQYTLHRLDDGAETGIEVYRLVYPSPVTSPFAENNLVPAEYYLPRERHGKLRAAIVLDIMYGNAVVARGLSRALAAGGVAALYVPMAYYNARRPKGRIHERFIEADVTRILDPPRQTVADIRRAKAILSQRPEIDADHIGITGVSLGGIVASLAAGVDGTFDRVVPILAGGDLAAITFHARETAVVKGKLLAKGYDLPKLRLLLAPIDPTAFASRLDERRCLMINAKQDEVIPRTCTDALWLAAGKPTILWVPSGHYSAAWFLPTIRRAAVDFLKGKPVDRLEF